MGVGGRSQAVGDVRNYPALCVVVHDGNGTEPLFPPCMGRLPGTHFDVISGGDRHGLQFSLKQVQPLVNCHTRVHPNLMQALMAVLFELGGEPLQRYQRQYTDWQQGTYYKEDENPPRNPAMDKRKTLFHI
jgi:hypothetical protein